VLSVFSVMGTLSLLEAAVVVDRALETVPDPLDPLEPEALSYWCSSSHGNPDHHVR